MAEGVDPVRVVASDQVVITAALTGPIATKADNPHLPTTPEEIAASARGAYEAGAAVVHIHLRDSDGRPTADRFGHIAGPKTDQFNLQRSVSPRFQGVAVVQPNNILRVAVVPRIN